MNISGHTIQILLITFFVNCTPADPKIEAESGYDAQQKACIVKFKTKSAIDNCRDDVKRAWLPSDAGADAQ